MYALRQIAIDGINEIAHLTQYQDIWPISKYFNKLLPIHKYRLIGKFAITDFHRLTIPGQIMQFITIFVSDS